jgi:hypothetical protein
LIPRRGTTPAVFTAANLMTSADPASTGRTGIIGKTIIESPRRRR